MKQHINTIGSIVFWMALGGAMVWLYQAGIATKAEKASERTATRAERQVRNQTIVAAGPMAQVFKTAEGEVIQLAIPISVMGGALVRQQKCTVWRDAVTKTSSLHCDREEIDLDAYSTDQPDVDPR